MSAKLAGSVQNDGSGSAGNTRANTPSATGTPMRDGLAEAAEHTVGWNRGAEGAVRLDGVDHAGQPGVGRSATAEQTLSPRRRADHGRSTSVEPRG